MGVFHVFCKLYEWYQIAQSVLYVTYNTWCPQNGQTQLKNLEAFAARFLNCVWQFCVHQVLLGLKYIITKRKAGKISF